MLLMITLKVVFLNSVSVFSLVSSIFLSSRGIGDMRFKILVVVLVISA